ncbi:hypothetical protein OFN73_01775 [Campylobacter sp. JMF_14 EL1]|nr:hypothetical protein [Campylobacter sp. JMF_14 EL1]
MSLRAWRSNPVKCKAKFYLNFEILKNTAPKFYTRRLLRRFAPRNDNSERFKNSHNDNKERIGAVSPACEAQ